MHLFVFNKCIMGQPAVVLRDGPRGPLWRDHVYDAVRACMAWKPSRHYLAPRPPSPATSMHVLTRPQSDGRTAVAVQTPFPAGLTAAIQSVICARDLDLRPGRAVSAKSPAARTLGRAVGQCGGVGRGRAATTTNPHLVGIANGAAGAPTLGRYGIRVNHM